MNFSCSFCRKKAVGAAALRFGRVCRTVCSKALVFLRPGGWRSHPASWVGPENPSENNSPLISVVDDVHDRSIGL